VTDPRVGRIGAAIVGPGQIARTHARAIRNTGARLRAVVAGTEAKAAAVRDEIGADRATADLSAVLADPAIDVIHICTPNAHHYAMARSALEAGKHVVLEKPLTITIAEGRDLLRRAEASGRVHAICFNTRFYPGVQEIRARVERGELGKALAVRASVLEDGFLMPTDWNWRFDASLGGPSVALSTIGCHLIDLVSFMIGDAVTEVCADLKTVHPRRRTGADGQAEVEVDGQEIAHLLVRFRHGCCGTLAVSQASAGRRYDYAVELDGTRQAFAWREPDHHELWIGHRDAPNQTVSGGPVPEAGRVAAHSGYGAVFGGGVAETFRQFVGRVYEAVAAEQPARATGAPYPTFRDGLAALCVHAASLTSGRSGRWETVEYGEP
jgi:predicted dehydrogenase